MKKQISVLALLAIVSAALSLSGPVRADEMDQAVFEGFLTTTLGPFGTTTAIMMENADIDTAMVEREAIMVVEENKVLVPSYLGAYAQKKGITDLRIAARQVVENGVE